MTKTTREKTKETVTYLAQPGMKPRKIFTVVKMTKKETTREQAKKEMIKKVEGITLITSDERDDDDFAEGWFVLRRKVLNTLKNSKEKG